MNPQYPAGASSSRHGQQPQQQQVQPAPQQAPAYDISHVGHYGASAAIASNTQVQELYGTHFHNVSHGLQGNYRDILTVYWQHMISSLENEEHDYKIHQLPLARIKKVMKADPEVKMISAEAPILFAKGCDIFITELTMRAWIHAEENKRRTLQRSDIASALAKSDMFDFLIDIVPREEAAHPKRSATTPSMPPGPTGTTPQMASAVPPPQMGGAAPPLGGQYGHMGGDDADQGYQASRQMYGIQGQPYQHEMYGGVDPYAYTMHQQPLYQIPGQRHDDGGEEGHFPREEQRDADAEAEAEHDYEVG